MRRVPEVLDGRRVADGPIRSRKRVRDGQRVSRGVDQLVRQSVARSVLGGEQDGIDTSRTVLEVTCRVVAPLLPLTAEAIWRVLTGGRFVHLTDWSLVDELPNDTTLGHAIDGVRPMCSGLPDGVGARAPALRPCRLRAVGAEPRSGT
jgi:anticodon-binding protein